MEITNEKIQEIERRSVEVIIKGLEQGVIMEEDMQQAASYILTGLKNVTNQDELLSFLRQLSSKWTIFTPVLVLESGEIKEKMEDRAVDQVLDLARKGDIKQALDIAKSATATN